MPPARVNGLLSSDDPITLTFSRAEWLDIEQATLKAPVDLCQATLSVRTAIRQALNEQSLWRDAKPTSDNRS